MAVGVVIDMAVGVVVDVTVGGIDRVGKLGVAVHTESHGQPWWTHSLNFRREFIWN